VLLFKVKTNSACEVHWTYVFDSYQRENSFVDFEIVEPRHWWRQRKWGPTSVRSCCWRQRSCWLNTNCPKG